MCVCVCVCVYTQKHENFCQYICNIIAEGFFLYYHFSFYISCLSVQLGREPFGLVHGLFRCTH